MKKNLLLAMGGIALIMICFASIGCIQARGTGVEKNSEPIAKSNDNQVTPVITNEVYDFSVIIVGSGTPEYSATKANACSMIQYNGKYYIVDCGDGTYNNLLESGFDFKNVAAIFFTHHHLDHTTDFFDIYMKCMMTNDSIEIVGPPRTGEFVDFFNSIFLDDVVYRKTNVAKNRDTFDKDRLPEFANVTEIIGEDEININGIQITTSEMTHTMYDLAYKFEVDGKSIVISGDTSYDDDLITLSKESDILVIDGSLYRPNTNEVKREREYIEPFYTYGGDFTVAPHLSFDDMVKIAAESGVSTLVITHFGDAEEKRIERSILEIKEVFDGEVIYASDMQEIGVADGTNGRMDKSLNSSPESTYKIVDTNQTDFYSEVAKISAPSEKDSFYGQDASYEGNQPSYIDNNDGTITDEITGLMWAKDMDEKMTYDEALAYANASNLGGYEDWRIPTIKELYSLIQFDGQAMGDKSVKLFIDIDYFNHPLGDTSKGEREIDAQTWSSTFYTGKTMGSDTTIFGVNFVDGRIKGYPKVQKRTGADNEMYFRIVRGNIEYGLNNYVDNGDGTITDLATGLTWQQQDSKQAMDWEEALVYAENLTLADYDDWRLPNAKELQSIVDYNRSLQKTNSAAIDPLFETTSILDAEGNRNYPYFWTSTTHLDGKNPYGNGVYIAFGEALGEMHGEVIDVHGSGAQRSDPKSGNEEDYPKVQGPQGDIRRAYNYVRCVKN